MDVPPLNATTAAEAGWVPTTVPVAYEGRTPTAACVPIAPNTCMGAPVSVAGENTYYVLENEGIPQRVALTVTWTAATPATAQLKATLLAVRSCGEDCWEGEPLAESVTGASPLAVGLDAVDLGEYDSLAVRVENAPLVPRPPMVFYYLALDQAFKVEGEVVVLAPAA